MINFEKEYMKPFIFFANSRILPKEQKKVLEKCIKNFNKKVEDEIIKNYEIKNKIPSQEKQLEDIKRRWK